MATKRTASKTAKAGKKKSATRSRKRAKPAAKASGPLVDVARKIGTTLGDLAVRTGLAKPGDDEPGPASQ